MFLATGCFKALCLCSHHLRRWKPVSALDLMAGSHVLAGSTWSLLWHAQSPFSSSSRESLLVSIPSWTAPLRSSRYCLFQVFLCSVIVIFLKFFLNFFHSLSIFWYFYIPLRLSWQPSPTNRAFPVIAPRTWNDLPDDVASAESLSAFRQNYSFVHHDYSLDWTPSNLSL